jgi:hypothetical protein
LITSFERSGIRRQGTAAQILPYSLVEEQYQFALLDLFGWLATKSPITREDRDVAFGLKPTPFGLAMATLLHSWGDRKECAEFDEDSLEPYQFGLLQATFQPYFPAWRKNLELPPPPEPTAGVYVWKVTMNGWKVWRLIALKHDQTLHDLMYAILDAIDFDDDHLYSFHYRDRLGRTAKVSHPVCEEDVPGDEVTVGSLPMKVGESLQLTYDFGDNWQFDVKLERIDPPGSVKKLPKVLESHGEAPPQYDREDEYDDFDEDFGDEDE